ncbi:pickpocket protein 28-like [Daphnia pulicaria]|uniref:pickpocket protein 28-like n=1 Tax=Daphnia pulicaria TaxID=35523 RepID=UPI001EEBE17A|nr:pickpocket protein 28-like [Daphnia pulicaria]
MTTKRDPMKKKLYSMKKLSKEFADNTSMHGLKFIAQDEATLAERILWIALFMVGLLFAVVFSWNLWENWKQSPVLITIQTANYPIKNYHFPTVTICSVNKVSTRALGEWMSTEKTKSLKLNEIRRILEIMSTNRVENEEEVAKLSQLLFQANISSNDEGYEKLMNHLSPNCSEMVMHCSWEGKEEDCANIFESEATDDGFCCSFNSIIIRRDAHSNTRKELRYAKTSGVYAGLTVLLNAEIADYNVTSSSISGFKVSIQDPKDFARTGRIGFLASPGSQVDAAVNGQTQIGDDQLRTIDLNKRLCTTNQEINLKYFEDYTGPYCQLDCLVTHFLDDCLCVPYYYPVPARLPVCNLSSYPCLERATERVVKNASSCDCPDVCTTVWYRNEISSGTFPNSVWEYPPTVIERPEFRDLSTEELIVYAKENFVKLNVYLKSDSGMCYIMKERTTWTDFISAAGGLLGLGFGFSILSAAELFYFFLVRWFYYWYQSKRQDQMIIKVRPSYPLINTRKQMQRKSNRVNFADSLSPTYKAWNRHRHTESWDLFDQPNLIRSWVDY